MAVALTDAHLLYSMSSLTRCGTVRAKPVSTQFFKVEEIQMLKQHFLKPIYYYAPRSNSSTIAILSPTYFDPSGYNIIPSVSLPNAHFTPSTACRKARITNIVSILNFLLEIQYNLSLFCPPSHSIRMQAE